MTMNNQTDELIAELTEEQAGKLAEMAGEYNIKTEDLVIFIKEKLPPFIEAVAAAIPVLIQVATNSAQGIVKALRSSGHTQDKQLRSIATTKEWHLYNHAKRSRVRKKYRDRLIKRLIDQAIPKGGRNGTR